MMKSMYSKKKVCPYCRSGKLAYRESKQEHICKYCCKSATVFKTRSGYEIKYISA